MASNAGAASAASEPRSLSILFGAREGEALRNTEGRSPRPQPPTKAHRRQAEIVRQGTSPEWAETPSAPRALRVAPGPQGHVGAHCFGSHRS
jgi:hypothetical protein